MLKEAMRKILNAWVDWLSSKKIITMLATLAMLVIIEILPVEISDKVFWGILGMGGLEVGGFALQDAGKEKARILKDK